ncbi:uncharacterized protein LOC142563080 isoform X1 [Dermacentor variabilis]|uniref:uncharacterized protein LOC142563080 isoform X1 n=1 Tax=Dermacentor variabilis TaxID=34621 RepID=UPI003F5C9B64
MASEGQRYTLCGFTQELDWRPLCFVEPIATNKLCDACGVLPRVTAFLPCRHVLCKSCYEQCLLDDGPACPLDGDKFHEEDAQWIHFPLENLLRRKVKCWNERHGCDMVLAASEQNKHFCNDCDHHSISCPRCSKVVLRRDVRAHLQSKCSDHVVSATSRPQQMPNSDNIAVMTALNASMDVRVGGMNNRLDQVITDSNDHSDRLSEISHCMNSMKETLLQIANESRTSENVASQAAATHCCSAAIQETLIGHREMLQELEGSISFSNVTLTEALEDTKRTVEQLKENTASNLLAELRQSSIFHADMFKKVCEVENTLKATFGKELQGATREICRNVAESAPRIAEPKNCVQRSGSSAINKQQELALNTISVRRYEFFVNKFKATKESAHSKGSHLYQNEKVYICGYQLSPGVHLRKEGEHVLLHARLQLHKGVLDEFLQWPFNQKIQLTIKHPSRDKHCQFLVETGDNLLCNARPEESSSRGSYFPGRSFRLDDLEREGYVTDDKLQIVWELVPKDIPK